MGQKFSLEGPPGGRVELAPSIERRSVRIQAQWSSRYPHGFENSVIEIHKVGGGCAHDKSKAAKVGPGTDGTVILNVDLYGLLTPGNDYYLKWIGSGRLLAESASFECVSGTFSAHAGDAEKELHFLQVNAKRKRIADAEKFMTTPYALYTAAERKKFYEYFKEIDGDSDGLLSVSEIIKYMNDKFGFELTLEQATAMVKEADTDTDGGISFQEFCTILKCAEDSQADAKWIECQAKIGNDIFEKERVRGSADKKQKIYTQGTSWRFDSQARIADLTSAKSSASHQKFIRDLCN
jgi:hypothetical protein